MLSSSQELRVANGEKKVVQDGKIGKRLFITSFYNVRYLIT